MRIVKTLQGYAIELTGGEARTIVAGREESRLARLLEAGLAADKGAKTGETLAGDRVDVAQGFGRRRRR